MQGAIQLQKSQSVIIDNTRWKFDSVYYMEETNKVYTKLWSKKLSQYLNIPIEEFIHHLKHGKKYIDS